MLEVTVVKHFHYREANALALQKYVASCDVFGMETSFRPGSYVVNQERKWNKLLKQNLSDTEFIELYDEWLSETTDPDGAFYSLALQRCLYSHKRILWNPERFPEREGKSIKARHVQAKAMSDEGLNLIALGYLQQGLPVARQGFSLLVEVRDRRDELIGKNVARCEAVIRERYSSLADVEPLRYTLACGAAHYPEKYIPGAKFVEELGTCTQKELLNLQLVRLAGEARVANSVDVARDEEIDALLIKIARML